MAAAGEGRWALPLPRAAVISTRVRVQHRCELLRAGLLLRRLPMRATARLGPVLLEEPQGKLEGPGRRGCNHGLMRAGRLRLGLELGLG